MEILITQQRSSPQKDKHPCVDFVKLKFRNEYGPFTPRGAVSRFVSVRHPFAAIENRKRQKQLQKENRCKAASAEQCATSGRGFAARRAEEAAKGKFHHQKPPPFFTSLDRLCHCAMCLEVAAVLR
jgi:hypothetical protein